LKEGKKIYFVSDVHLGSPQIADNQKHERKIVAWLDSIKDSAEEIYLLGDIFDFWFEYKRSIPKGFSRFIGKLCELNDAGIPVHFFTGNHDIWIFDYLPAETGIIVHKKPLITEIDNFRFFISHGDGLTRHEKKLKFYKKVFNNRIAQWFFSWLHPDIGIKLAELWSSQNRKKHVKPEFKGVENEWLIQCATEKIQKEHFDYFIFGHRHIDKITNLNEKCRLVYLGDWISIFSYGEWDGKEFRLKYFTSNQSINHSINQLIFT